VTKQSKTAIETLETKRFEQWLLNTSEFENAHVPIYEIRMPMSTVTIARLEQWRKHSAPIRVLSRRLDLSVSSRRTTQIRHSGSRASATLSGSQDQQSRKASSERPLCRYDPVNIYSAESACDWMARFRKSSLVIA
jgi:hypothetical protein